MEAPIKDLVELQRVDSAVEAENREIASIPGALEAMAALGRELEEGLVKRREGLKESQKRRRHLEGELEMAKQKLSRYQGQLMEVKTNEAYRAMLKEIETVKAEVGREEEGILEEMLRSDDLAQAIKGGEADANAARERMGREKADLERRGREAEERRRLLEAERDSIAGRIGGAVLETYRRIARLRGGVGVAEARDETCMGCRVKLRPQVCQEVRIGADLRQCDSCGRFLYILDRPEAPAVAPAPAGEGAPSHPDEPAA